MKPMASEKGKSRSSSNHGKRNRGAGYVMCIDNDQYAASLEVGKIYRVAAGDSGVPKWIRVIDESGDDYLYPAKRFVAMTVPPKGKRALAAAAK